MWFFNKNKYQKLSHFTGYEKCNKCIIKKIKMGDAGIYEIITAKVLCVKCNEKYLKHNGINYDTATRVYEENYLSN